MKSLILCALVIASQYTLACDKPYRMQVGAFFNSSSVVAFWSEFAQEISKRTKCPTNIHPSNSYEQHVIDSVMGYGDIFMVPTYYTRVLQQYGLEKIITTNAHTQTYLVTQKQYNPHDLTSLKDTSIQLSSKYTVAYLLIMEKLAKLDIEHTVTFSFGSSFQSNAMSVIKGQMDAAVIFSPAFDPLPDAIKSKVNYTPIAESYNSGSIMVKQSAPDSLKQAVLAAKDKIKLLKWKKASEKDEFPEYKTLFENQIKDIFQSNKQNPPTNK